MKKALFTGVALLTSVSAHAVPITGPMGTGTLTATSAVGATASPFALSNYGTSTTVGFVSNATFTGPNGGVVSFGADTAVPRAGFYANNSGVATSPFASTNLAPLTTEYIVAQPGDAVSVTTGAARNTYNLLWGSVDAGNAVDFDFFNNGTLVSDLRVTGAQVAAAVGGGFQANGTASAFVTISDPTAFTNVSFTTPTIAFEFVPGAAVVTAVPEPMTVTMFGFGLLALGFVQYRRHRG